MQPVVRAGRVVGLDAARALALVGMMATHVFPVYDGDGVTFSHHLASGRASALFAVLAGTSLALMSGRTLPHRGRRRLATSAGLAVRALLVAAVGLLLGEVDSGIAVILSYYGVLFLLAIPFLGLGARAAAVLCVVWLLAAPVLSHVVRPHLPPATYANPTFGSLADPWQLLTELTFTGYYPAVPWLAFVLAGIAVGRLALASGRTPVRLAVTGAGLAVTTWALSTALLDLPDARQRLAATFTGPSSTATLSQTLESGLYGTTPTGSWWWLAVRTPHTATPLDLAHTIGTSLLVIGLCVLAGRVAPRPLAVVLGAGAMTLTLYSAHVVSRNDGWWDGSTTATYLGQVLVVLGVGAAFALARRRGPLEAGVAVVQRRVSRAAAAPPRR